MAIPIDDEILALKNRLGELRKEKKREYLREYSQRPEVQKKRGEYFRRPEVKEKQREYLREYSQRPEVKEKHREYMREYMREYSRRPEVQKKRGEYFRRPEVKEKQREYQREYFQRPEVKLAAKLRRNGIPEEVIKAELSRLKEAAE